MQVLLLRKVQLVSIEVHGTSLTYFYVAVLARSLPRTTNDALLRKLTNRRFDRMRRSHD